MPLRKFAVTALAGLAVIAVGAVALAQDVVVDPAIASMTPEQMVEMRKATMKEDGGLLRSAGSLTGAEAVAAADKLIANYTNLTALFPEGSMVGDTKALPAIWENYDAFQAILAQGIAAATAMKLAAEAGDATAYGAANNALGATCGACHQQFRS